MMQKRWMAALLIALVAGPAAAQIGLPNFGGAVGSALGSNTGTLDRLRVGEALTAPVRSVADMARDRVSRLTGFLRSHRDLVEADEHGDPARRGVVLMLDADRAGLDIARQNGFAVSSVEAFGNLGLSAAELAVPAGMSLSTALASLRQILPDRTFTADQLHFPSGVTEAKAASVQAVPISPILTPVGMIDSGVEPVVTVVKARGFATGAIRASDHGSAIASLLRHAGVQTILSADVFGSDPAGGGALAIVRALEWLAGEHVPVISISLTGPSNPLLARAIAAVSGRSVIVAAVGNDGPAAPPAFPASYPGVLAVTGVDGRGHALIEAGRPLHLDYAAPALI